MNNERYQHMLEHIARQTGMDAERLMFEQTMQHEGVRLDFMHLPLMNLIRISVLLEPLRDDSGDVLRVLLEGNAQPRGDWLDVMSLDRKSGRPQVHFHLPLTELAESAVGSFLSFGLQAYLSHWNALWQELAAQFSGHPHQLA